MARVSLPDGVRRRAVLLVLAAVMAVSVALSPMATNQAQAVSPFCEHPINKVLFYNNNYDKYKFVRQYTGREYHKHVYGHYYWNGNKYVFVDRHQFVCGVYA